MEQKHAVYLIGVVVVLCGMAAETLGGETRVGVRIEGVTSIARTDDDFICATLDWWPTDKCNYGQCPWGKAGLINLDLSNSILQNAIKAFSPLRIRLGGSLQDQVLYKIGKSVKNCPKFERNDDGLFGFTDGCLTMDRWDQLNSLFNQTGAKITFGLNALFGKKKSETEEGLWIGDWDARNSHDLMRYTIEKGYSIDSYELGNELCSSGVSARINVDQYAKDFKMLKKLVQKLYPNVTTPKVLGPAGFYDEKWFNEFLLQTGPDVVDGLTHHIYNLGPGVDKTLIDKIQDPFYLTQIAQTFKDISSTIDRFGPWAGAWVGEAGGAYNSGGKDVSHTFANGFWYIDQLGMTSAYNHKVFCRQALIGGNYALLNTTSFIPNPDYYGALLWHRLMGSRVLRVTQNGSPYLRVYAHCAREKPGVTLVVINLSNTESFDLKVEDDMNYYIDYARAKREEYHLTPMDGDIQSDVVLLNGKALKLTETEEIPEMKAKMVDSSTPIHVQRDSIVFVTLRDFIAPACA
ncbi:PREDICTED: heparanase-like protein 2 [Tarenaya hassleriana]|uniref:heparanase-like protein 2 n=1 Tax=Tarenaya hassleriana TaxID=28532 RepID=UPI0008FD663A|nr:PREDICTED: heparanase-like protein 2 [Tarenaya hassleriana]